VEIGYIIVYVLEVVV